MMRDWPSTFSHPPCAFTGTVVTPRMVVLA
jgi:hypothetical protein